MPQGPASLAGEGSLIAVVGPSGVGKDTLMEAVAAARGDVGLVRRHITRAADLGGEDYEPVSQDSFLHLKSLGAYALSWEAHGLMYGIPKLIEEDLAAGKNMLVNLSRSVLAEADTKFARFMVINVTADPEILARRLAERGRESAEEIAARLSRPPPALPAQVALHTVENNGPLEETVAAICAILDSQRG